MALNTSNNSSVKTIIDDVDSNVINALRGYAILLVIFSHITSHIPTMVWPPVFDSYARKWLI